MNGFFAIFPVFFFIVWLSIFSFIIINVIRGIKKSAEYERKITKTMDKIFDQSSDSFESLKGFFEDQKDSSPFGDDFDDTIKKAYSSSNFGDKFSEVKTKKSKEPRINEYDHEHAAHSHLSKESRKDEKEWFK